VVGLLPAREAGHAGHDEGRGGLFPDDTQALREALLQDRLGYHEGRIGGAFPRVLPTRRTGETRRAPSNALASDGGDRVSVSSIAVRWSGYSRISK
jgi:hypothetical protein